MQNISVILILNAPNVNIRASHFSKIKLAHYLKIKKNKQTTIEKGTD